MSCCCGHNQATGRFFSFFAGRYRKRFERKGFEPSQLQLLEGLEQAGFTGASLLEIGCGVGHLHQTLLERGASTATGVDLAPKMLEEARRWAVDRGLSDRTHYIDGDFVEVANQVEPADVVLLDKVICCYPDVSALVPKSLERARRIYAVTYPRNRLLTRMVSRLMGGIFCLVRTDFRNYIHDPEQVEAWATQAGFTKLYEQSTFIWLTQVYVRQQN